ncbi:MAG: phosphatase PAP2 family protein [Lachnospiraceae bacterium]|nr:phosphatase PAP2 family protein [Lachnospiraceae bacterium]
MQGKEITAKIKNLIQKYPLLVSVGYFCIYFPIFGLLEMFRAPEYYVHCRLDDFIPYNGYFIIPYVLWYLFVPGMLLFFIRYSKADYFKCCKVIFGGMSICLLIYWLFPTGLQLREPIANDNLCNQIVNLLRVVDTPTNVCPSIHVSSTVGICLVLLRSKELKRFRVLTAASCVLGVLICLSTMFIDQHSVIDVICGFALSAVLSSLMEQTESQPQVSAKKAFGR